MCIKSIHFGAGTKQKITSEQGAAEKGREVVLPSVLGVLSEVKSESHQRYALSVLTFWRDIRPDDRRGGEKPSS